MAVPDSDDLLRQLARAPDAAPDSTPRAAFGAGGVRVDRPVRLEAGQVIGERFEVIGAIGRGGMGEVYRARDHRLGREVAIKVLSRTDPEHQRRLEREARATSSIGHPHVLAVHDTGTHDDAPYLVLELVEGGTLRDRLTGPPPGAAGVRWIHQVALGLAAAHAAGVIHRDLKPENVLFTRGGDVKIADFGLAKLVGARPRVDSLTDDGVVMGTTPYLSPEQARGEEVDHRADLFALGAILVELFTGRPPFLRASTAETLTAILRDPPDLAALPAGLAAIAERCLAKSPAARFQTADDLAFALAQHDGRVLTTRRQVPPRRRRRLVVGAIAAALAVAAAAAVAVAVLARRPAPPSPSTATAPPAPAFARLTFRRGTLHAARFAPDGAAVVHSAAWDGEPPELYVTEPGLYEARRLGVAGELLAVSATGQLLVKQDVEARSVWGFWTAGRLARVPLHGGAPRTVADHVSEADVAADGTVAAARLVDGRWTLEWPLGTPVYATRGWIGQPRLSPDGTLLAFLDHPLPEDDSGAVAVLDRAGHLRRLTGRYLSLQGLAWTPAGDRLAFTAALTGAARGLRTVSLLGIDDRARHDAPAALRVLDVGAGGRALVARDDHRVRMVAVEPDGRQRDLSWLDGSAVQSWSRDDRQLSFTESWDGAGPEYGVYLRPYDGGPAVRVAEGAIGELSPTADELLVPRTAADGHRTLWRVPTGAGQAREVPVPGLDVAWARWFPDGAHALVVTIDGELAIAGEGAPRRLGVRTRDVFRVAVAPDGRRVAYLDAAGPALLDVEDGRRQPVPAVAAGEAPLAFDRSGAGLFLSGPPGLPAQLVHLDLATGARTTRALAPGDPAGVPALVRIAVAHDDRRVVFSYLQTLSTLYDVRDALP